jgi:hypothetical protein
MPDRDTDEQAVLLKAKFYTAKNMEKLDPAGAAVRSLKGCEGTSNADDDYKRYWLECDLGA